MHCLVLTEELSLADEIRGTSDELPIVPIVLAEGDGFMEKEYPLPKYVALQTTQL